MTAPSRCLIPPAAARIGWIVLSNAAFWLVLCLIGATGSYSDTTRSGDDADFARLLQAWCWDHLPVCLLGIALHLLFQRWPGCLDSARRLAAGYCLVLLLFLPAELLFIAAHHMLISRSSPGAHSVVQRVLDMRRFTWFTELAWTSGTYVGVVALCVWRRHRERERAWLQAERDNLDLRLQNLRGQLEPHFMFNALNAISALVRQDDRALALAGIRRLSDLLRYALAASERSWVLVADELQFTRDYLALQQLRYRERLQVKIAGAADSTAVLGADCPPLLLQPLVENALRHGLDRHAGPLEVRIDFALQGEELRIRISNALVAASAPNPGLGTGLRNVRERLRTASGPAASPRAEAQGADFVAELRMPACRADAESLPA
jgi:hypothetical protein